MSKVLDSRDDIKVLELKDQKCKFEEWKQDRSRWTASWGGPEVKQEAPSNVDAVQQVLDLTHPVDKRSQHILFYGEKIEALRRTRSVKRSRSLFKLMLRSWINGAKSTIKNVSKNRINCRKKIAKPMRRKIADQLLRSRNQPE